MTHKVWKSIILSVAMAILVELLLKNTHDKPHLSIVDRDEEGN